MLLFYLEFEQGWLYWILGVLDLYIPWKLENRFSCCWTVTDFKIVNAGASVSINVDGICLLISLGPALGHHFTLHYVHLEYVLVPNSLANFATPFFFFNLCLCTILSIVCQKWNASARRESPTEADYAITVFTSTSFLSLFLSTAVCKVFHKFF